MKKILTWMLSLLIVAGSTFANDSSGINERITRSFQKDFATAKNVQTESVKDLVKVTFTLNDQIMYAFYTEGGDLVAVTRNLTSTQLPINLLTELKNKYASSWITDLFEIASDHVTSYYVTLENPDYKVILKATGNGSWDVYQKEKKQAE
jgi:hypothetical protein